MNELVKSKEKQTELSPIHDFASKLRQPQVLDQLKDYVRFQSKWRKLKAEGKSLDDLEGILEIPNYSPVSINLDLTTACNYRCDHCVDFDILNKNIRFDHEKLKEGLAELQQRGLRSVIIIGGGEPTVYPGFADMVTFMKGIDLQIGVVTNGSRLDRVLEVAQHFEKDDWVRLSLDSGTNDTFISMHKPRTKVTLESICAGVRPIKEANPDLTVGFSFIIVWKDCEANDFTIHENVQEIVQGATLARDSGFDYISFKPFLTRAEVNNAEVVELTQQESRLEQVMTEIRRRVDEPKQLATPTFRVIESTNLKVLENGTYANYTEQPRHCHMQFFRQVLSPLGLFNCPVYRHVPQAQISHKHGYSDLETFAKTQRSTLELIDRFDASSECKDVTCLYNHVNWYLEDLIQHPDKLDAIEPAADRRDYFL